MKSRCAVLAALLLISVPLLSGCRRGAGASGTPPANLNSATFVDVAQTAGISFVHTTGADGKFRYIESTPGGCAFLDFDGDGYLDVLLVQSGPSGQLAPGQTRPHCALYRNTGQGRFTDVTAGSGLDKDLGYGHGVAVGDFDNDGYPDVFLTSYPRNYLLRNQNGSGKFADVSGPMGLDKTHSTGYATSAAWGDYDSDGRLDLYVCYYAPWTPEKDKVCRNAGGKQDYCAPQLYDPEVHKLWHNDGARFTDVTHRAGIDRAKGRGLAVAWTDYNGDGRQDIFVANDITPTMLWRNNGDGTFTDEALVSGVAYAEGGGLFAGMGIGLADYDRSGRESAFMTNFSGQPKTLFRNSGDGLFENVSTVSGVSLPQMKYLSFGCEFLDFDADGWSDLVVANGHVQMHIAEGNGEGTTYAERKQLFRNQGGGKFAEIADPSMLGDLNRATVARGLAVGDFDNDGRVDILISSQNHRAELLRNQNKSQNHWISFRTIGTKSNRDGRHAAFTVTTSGGVRQTGVVRAGSSYLSHSDPRVYFGLGAEKTVNVEVRWPSGTRDTLKGIAADTFYTVTEGRGITQKQAPSATPDTAASN